jgi:hypothetical protein|tara:strand:- start:718 stop:948 length:231 start_codon:yes stop_codon:yes gene_type:complete
MTWKNKIKKQLTPDTAASFIDASVKNMISILNNISNKQANVDVNNDGQVTNIDLQEINKAINSLKFLEEFFNKIYR